MATNPRAPRSRRRRAWARQLARRRRSALGAALAGAALIAFAFGALIGAGTGGDAGGTGESGPTPPFALAPLPSLDDAELAGQRLVAGFSGTEPPAGLQRLIARGRLAGVVLFAANLDGPAATRKLTAELQRIPRPAGLEAPLAVMVDQEGGTVKRLDGPPRASAAEMGTSGVELAAREGAATARSLGGLGINVNLAPVLDVARAGSAIAREQRSFGSAPADVTATAVAGFAAAQQSGGVAATAKHFPGLGAAALNTDQAEQRIGLDREELRRIDEAPFAAFAAAGGKLVMLSLASYPAFGGAPAALNPSLASDELRGRIGFRGVSITDSLDAAAALGFGSREQVALAAAGAGSDLLLYGDWRTARAAGATLRRALATDRLDRGAFEESVQRVLALRASLPS